MRPTESTPEVSVLLPVRDAEGSLPACIASIECQTFQDWECIAVDDGSHDGSLEILRSWEADSPRVTVASVRSPGGIVPALEEARRLARAPFLARHDADDCSTPRRLERQLAVIRSAANDLAVLGCLTIPRGREPTDGMRRYLGWLDHCAGGDWLDHSAAGDAEGDGVAARPPAGAWETSAEICSREIWIECPIAHPTAMMRASSIARVGGYRATGGPEDYDLWLRLHRAGFRIASLFERLYEWTDRADRLSRLDPRYAPIAFLRCRVHHLRRWLCEHGAMGSRPLLIWGAGRDGRRFARAWEEDERSPGPAPPAISAFVDIDPRKIGRSRRGRPVVDLATARRAYPEAFFLIAVGVEGAREIIRGSMRAEGLLEGRDFLCVQ